MCLNQRQFIDEAMIRQHLEKADSRIAEADSLITRQQRVVVECFAGGHSAQEAIELLGNLTVGLQAMLQTREYFLSELSIEQARIKKIAPRTQLS